MSAPGGAHLLLKAKVLYTSTFVRYERTGDRVVPVRITKTWTTMEVANIDARKPPREVRKFKAVRVSQVPWRQLSREPAQDEAGKLVAWVSSVRVETRARILTLGNVRECGMPNGVLKLDAEDQWLPCFTRSTLEDQPGGGPNGLQMYPAEVA